MAVLLGGATRMNNSKKKILLDLCMGEIDKKVFLHNYEILEDDIPREVERLFWQAMNQNDADAVEFALMLGFSFSFPLGIVEVLHDLLNKDWHTKHEEIIGLLQRFSDALSVPAIRNAISLKPNLKYLDYDDYGAYYKKCLWALQAINTGEAKSLVDECTNSNDIALQEQALYRLKKWK